jgi:hypothetical protein
LGASSVFVVLLLAANVNSSRYWKTKAPLCSPLTARLLAPALTNPKSEGCDVRNVGRV